MFQNYWPSPIISQYPFRLPFALRSIPISCRCTVIVLIVRSDLLICTASSFCVTDGLPCTMRSSAISSKVQICTLEVILLPFLHFEQPCLHFEPHFCFALCSIPRALFGFSSHAPHQAAYSGKSSPNRQLSPLCLGLSRCSLHEPTHSESTMNSRQTHRSSRETPMCVGT